jgi:hypothetical protein
MNGNGMKNRVLEIYALAEHYWDYPGHPALLTALFLSFSRLSSFIGVSRRRNG